MLALDKLPLVATLWWGRQRKKITLKVHILTLGRQRQIGAYRGGGRTTGNPKRAGAVLWDGEVNAACRALGPGS